MNSVTDIINNAHLSNNSTLGSCDEIEIYGSPLVPSLNFSSAYAFQSIKDLGKYHENKYESIRYTRDSSVIVKQVEHYLELMHDDAKTLLFNSGMSAIASTISTLVDKNTVIVTFGVFYRKSFSIIEDLDTKFDINNYNFNNIEDYIKMDFQDKKIIILLESPANPFLTLVDVEKIKEINPNTLIILDITLQGLVNCKNDFNGADLIVSSCTKYIGGHNDILGGFVICKNDFLFSKIWNERSMKGGIIDNFSAYMLLRSLRTYDIRMEKTISNMEQVLSFLDSNKYVLEIYYPGSYENKNQKELFEKTHYHGGGLVTFRVDKTIDLVANLEKLCSTKMAPSFGSVDSLIEIPAFMSHWGKSTDELEKLGLDDRIVRFSVGNEGIKFILADLEKVLHA